MFPLAAARTILTDVGISVKRREETQVGSVYNCEACRYETLVIAAVFALHINIGIGRGRRAEVMRSYLFMCCLRPAPPSAMLCHVSLFCLRSRVHTSLITRVLEPGTLENPKWFKKGGKAANKIDPPPKDAKRHEQHKSTQTMQNDTNDVEMRVNERFPT